MAPTATAGPSSHHGGAGQKAQQPQLQRKKGQKGKAGGNGKKGKVFVEGKADLLSLISDITSTKDSAAQQKVDKRKNAIESQTEGKVDDGKGKKSRKAEEREKALESAKSALLEKQRLKKKRKGSSKTTSTSGSKGNSTEGEEGGVPAKKRVLFA
ncbi:hypothetical protein IAT40_000588 [Kwoniella sp. CBS 6097]